MYKNSYMNMQKLAEKIQSGQYESKAKTTRQSMMARPEKLQEKEPEENSNDRMLQYYMAIKQQNQAMQEGLSEAPQGLSEGPSKGSPDAPARVPKGELAQGIKEAADALGVDAVDLATIISYETGGTFDPLQKGPTTKWGQHKGLIQFGEPQAKQHGVDWSDPLGSQLGAEGAVVNYFKFAGAEPGMGLLDLYSIVNAGGPNRYDASDTAAGGAPGTVRDKVEKQMSGHRKKAEGLFG